jgi:hypothetical protein
VAATACSGCCLIVLFGCINSRRDLAGKFAAKGVDQLGHALVPPHSSEGTFGFEHAGGDPARFFMEPSFHLVTRPVVRLAIEIIDSMQLVEVSVSARVPPTPRRRTVNMLSSPSRNDAAASGWSASSSLARLLAANPLAASGPRR